MRTWRSAVWIGIAVLLLQIPTTATFADDMGGEEPIVVEGEAEVEVGGESEEPVEPSRRRFDASLIGASALDLVLLRPLGVGASAVGLGLFIVTSPFVAPSMDYQTSWDIFVVGPTEYTFLREIGTI